MINFFRKTRKKLADDNKFFKYSRYAIGEILLVVIGILIALQVNDWNENRKQEIRKREVTKSLAVELNHVLNYTEEQVNMMNDRIEYYTKILHEWETLDPKTIPKDSLSGYYFLIHTATLLKYNPRIGYYNSLISSGEIKLIPDNLVAKLNYLYEKHTKDVVTYVDQEVDLHVLIAAVVAKNHSKVFLSGNPDSASSPELYGLNVLDTTTTINFLNSIKGDGELKSLIFRNLTILKTKRALLTGRIIPDINNLVEDFESD